MFIEKSMTRKVVSVLPDLTIFKAREIMKESGIRHLPVVDDDRILKGIVTDRDIRSVLPSIMLDDFESKKERERIQNVTVGEIMTRDVVTVSPSDTLPDALLRMHQTKVGAFPVVDESRRLKGIISIRDLLRAFINVLNIGEPGALFGILVEEKTGQMKKIVDAITEENVSFGSILVANYWEKNKRAVFPYLLTLSVGRIKKKLETLGFTLIDPMEWYLDQLPKE